MSILPYTPNSFINHVPTWNLLCQLGGGSNYSIIDRLLVNTILRTCERAFHLQVSQTSPLQVQHLPCLCAGSLSSVLRDAIILCLVYLFLTDALKWTAKMVLDRYCTAREKLLDFMLQQYHIIGNVQSNPINKQITNRKI